jgi:hypothetical protein
MAVGATFTAAPAEKGSRLLAHFWQGDLMANDSNDDSVLGHIDGLVKEEERSTQNKVSRTRIATGWRR